MQGGQGKYYIYVHLFAEAILSTTKKVFAVNIFLCYTKCMNKIDKLLLVLCPDKHFSNRASHMRFMAREQIETWMKEEYQKGREDLEKELGVK